MEHKRGEQKPGEQKRRRIQSERHRVSLAARRRGGIHP
jgi:hypothetical protein